MKVAALFSARASGPARLELFGERTADIDTLNVGPWVKDAILLIDLGFNKHQGFARVEEDGGFILSRLKGNANPLLSGSPPGHRGRRSTSRGSGGRRSPLVRIARCWTPRWSSRSSGGRIEEDVGATPSEPSSWRSGTKSVANSMPT